MAADLDTTVMAWLRRPTLLPWLTVTRLRRRAASATVALALVVAACSTDDESTPQTTAAATTTTTIEPARSGNGRLDIGVLLPMSETLIGEPTVAATRTAVERINEAGGVLGRSVRLVVADEGSTSATASEAVQLLLSRGVDTIVGPASSIIALTTLDEIVSPGVLACSPTASALALDDYPDDNLFFRTIPSDSLQAEAIATVAAQTGTQRTTIVYVDDAYGRAFADAVEASLANGPITEVEPIPFGANDEDLTDAAAAVVDSSAAVTIVLANDDDGTRFIETLGQLDTSGLTRIVVNGAMRTSNASQRIEALDPALREMIVGVAPQAESPLPDEPFDPPGPYAANAFDCVNLIALAAVSADSDAPAEIAAQMASVSANGAACGSFAECVANLEAGLQIDYNGPSGLTELHATDGDTGSAVFDIFAFDETGRDRLVRVLTAGA